MSTSKLVFVLAGAGMLGACSGGGSSVGSIDTTTSAVSGSGSVGSTTAGSSTPVTAATLLPLSQQTSAQTYNTFSASQHFDDKLQTTKRTVSIEINDPVTGIAKLATGTTPFVSTFVTAGSQFYQAEQPVGSNANIAITYDPRDSTYALVVASAGITDNTKFQDPIHRTILGAARDPAVPDLVTNPGIDRTLDSIKYYQAGTGNVSGSIDGLPANETYNTPTLFFADPDPKSNPNGTRYVTWNGYVNNTVTITRTAADTSTTPDASGVFTSTHDLVTSYEDVLNRHAFVYGLNSPNSAVPKSGSGSFTGDMFAFITDGTTTSVGASISDFQYIKGTAITTVNFASNTFQLALDGKVGLVGVSGGSTQGQYTNLSPQQSPPTLVTNGTAFHAVGTGSITRAASAAFDGLSSAFSGSFNTTTANPGNVATYGGSNLTVAASSIEGGFFGPTAQEVGGAFRIIGKTPDHRLDIIGAFVGK